MILKGDCIEVMKAMKPNSVDAIVCDPPYGLEFMGKEWDKLDKPGRDRSKAIQSSSFGKIMDSNYETPRVVRSQRRKCSVCGGYSGGPFKLCSCDNPKWIPSPYPVAMQLWHTQWLTEAYRVLKPGGSMLVMGGTRTFHRLACAIEDSGFIIKDTLMWLYGSGFPKAQDLGKMIDKRMGKLENQSIGFSVAGDDGRKAKLKQTLKYRSDYGYEYKNNSDLAKHWDGFKVGGIKPAYEPIIWAVKPPEGSYVDNVLKHGVGAVNVDECRIEHDGNLTKGGCTKYGGMFGNNGKVNNPEGNSKGRFPANVILDEEAGRMLDEQSGNCRSAGNYPQAKRTNKIFSSKTENVSQYNFYSDNGGASRFFYCAKASRGERNAGLDGMEKKECFNLGHKDNPGRKAPKKSYPRQNNHPTVKPIKLFEYLIKLVTREGQIILDPFMGSGTTSIAAHNTGRKCIGIEKEDEYLTIAKRRIDHWKNQPQQLALGDKNASI